MNGDSNHNSWCFWSHNALYFSTSPQRHFVGVEHGWFVEKGVNEQIDLWNTVVDVERMQANRADVQK